jgi:sugar phosphate isomerase/epimerase
MFVACSTRCFSKQTLESALRRIAELEFNKFDLAIIEDGAHLRPSDVADNPDQAIRRLKQGPSLTPSSLDLDFGDVDEKTYRKRFEAICRFAKPLTVAVLTIPAAPVGTSLEEETARLGDLTAIAMREGLVLTLATHRATLTGDPAIAAALCKAVPGLALTLDPSHYIHEPQKTTGFDELYPFVQNVQFRDTGKGPGEFQVRIGQGKIDYARVVNQLNRQNYQRGLSVTIRDDLDSPFEAEVEVRKLKLLLESLI